MVESPLIQKQPRNLRIVLRSQILRYKRIGMLMMDERTAHSSKTTNRVTYDDSQYIIIVTVDFIFSCERIYIA